MRFSLSDDEVAPVNKEAMRAISHPKTLFYLTGLLTASTREIYQNAAMNLRNHLKPKSDSSETYICPHPDWFDDTSPTSVDSMTCRYCGFSQKCTLGSKKQQTVGIFPLGTAKLPPADVLRPIFTNHDFDFDFLPMDPFIGFSHSAGNTRDLYLIKIQELDELIPCLVEPNTPYHCAVGVDRFTQKVIWPFDQLLLVHHHQAKKSPSRFGVHKPEPLTKIDQRLLLKATSLHGWSGRLPEDSGSCIEDIFSRVIAALKSTVFGKDFANIFAARVKPLVDHPYSVTGSGEMLCALRMVHFFPDMAADILADLNISQQLFQPTSRDVPLPVKSNNHLSDDNIRYFPRFPAIAFLPEEGSVDFHLELPQCKIIDVKGYPGDEGLLLLDGLGINLMEELIYEIT